MKHNTKPGFEPHRPATISDPYPIYRDLRTNDPVHWNPKGFWFISKYADVLECLTDTRLSNRPAPFALVHSRNREKFVAADIANNLIAFKDAPEHTKLRGWLTRSFVQNTKNREALYFELATGYREHLARKCSIEFVSEFALPFASRAICDVLGFPSGYASRLATWSTDFFLLFHSIPDRDDFNRLNESLSAFRQCVLSMMRDRQASPRNDVISDLVSSMNGSASDNEVVDNVMLLAADGIGNVQAGLTNCLSTILEQKRLPEQLFGDTKDIARLVDECLRLESPGQYQGRITKEPIEIGGKTIRANSIVLLGLASANRDETEFENPNDFLPSEKRSRHLAFGSGPHMCLGSSVVRTEIVQVLRALFEKDELRITTSSRREWLVRPGHRWLKRLNVQVQK